MKNWKIITTEEVTVTRTYIISASSEEAAKKIWENIDADDADVEEETAGIESLKSIMEEV